ncbi:DNA polymerase III subunit alpha [Candidatus Poribacteria bacterium]|nr:DNA polymerase III subunit alpha [Candidatus Poribacteria bacterium]MYA54756.1 DNA polymerase III subunit alpha [Candidatus Poribacteria bacterium]
MATEFVHLHNHSEYSMLDGACRIEDMIKWAVENGAPAVALTDHGNMFGAWELYSKATKAGVNPIVGCEVYVAPGSRREKKKGQGGPYHLTLLAEDATGYQNLLKLVSLGYTEGFYSRPRVDMEILREYHAGIIALTGCIQGQVPQLLCSNRREEGIQNFKTLMEIMGKDNLYVEVQNHYIDKELEAYPVMAQLAKEFNLPLVATNDCHYLHKSDHEMHDVLLCIQTRRTVKEQNRLRFDNHFYFKSVDEMREALKDYPPEAISNTLEIANRCNLKLDYGESVMPRYEVPEGHTNDSYLKELCYQGLKEKYGGQLSEPIRQRLDYELDTISKTDYSGYFLIVWDYVKYAHKQGYPLSARGSAASSLVLYALDVITFNPMDYDCLFERFLNLERISPPDIDIDFADRAREHVINYLREKYGEDSVGKVATFATLGAKAAIKDVGRALEVPLEDVAKLTELIPTIPGITLDEALEKVPEFQALAERPENKELMDLSRSVEGMKRHVSCHASAIVVSNGPLTNFAPLFKDKHDQVATQFEGKTVEDVGIVKFDSLGLRSLTEIYDCLQMVKANHGKDIKLEDIPFDDKKTYSLISRGLIAGLFQLETSSGMYRVVTQMKPDNFEQFTTIPALYRPGPLESGTMQDFIDRKNRLKPVQYIHPSLESALQNTYGVCVYQEQVMQIARDMAGFTLGEADILRSAMGKKDAALLQAQRDKFIEGAVENGITQQEAENVFTQLEPFAGYAFNKSHTVAYSMLAYRMAYLKAHYPHEFMAAMMTGEAADSLKITRYRAECKKLAEFLEVDINLIPPDVNSSSRAFTVDGNDICFGLVAVKGVGDGAIDAIVDARGQGGSFKSLQDFCERVDTKQVNKRAVESLILSGAFDSLEGHRAQHIDNLDNIMRVAQNAQAERDRGQMSLFGNGEEAPTATVTLTDAPEYDPLERLMREKEQLGFYVSGHPLEEYSDIIESYTSASTQTLIGHRIDSEVDVVGMITEVKNITTRKGDPMAVIGLEDLEGAIEVVIFPDAYKTAGDLGEGRVVWIRGKVNVNQNSRNRRAENGDAEREERQIQADRVIDIESVSEQQTSALEVTIPESDVENVEKLERLKEIVRANKGDLDLILRLISPHYGEVIARCAQKYSVAYTPQVIEQVEGLFGENSVKPSNLTIRGNKSQTSHMDFV